MTILCFLKIISHPFTVLELFEKVLSEFFLFLFIYSTRFHCSCQQHIFFNFWIVHEFLQRSCYMRYTVIGVTETIIFFCAVRFTHIQIKINTLKNNISIFSWKYYAFSHMHIIAFVTFSVLNSWCWTKCMDGEIVPVHIGARTQKKS